MVEERRQNRVPAKNTKNGHRVAASSGGDMSISSGDSCFKSMSFGVSIIELFEGLEPGFNGKDHVNILRKSET